METEIVTRKDGIVYERKRKPKNLECMLNIRFTKKEMDKIKEIAEKEGKKYQPMIREIICDFIEYYERSEEDE